jgi:type I restriction enzyme, R subunit
MVFLIRAMRSHPELRRFKIVLVTDRTDLQDQLGDTAALTGETIKVARNANEVKELLSQPGPGVVMAMIQKYRDTDNGGGDGLSGSEAFGTLNESDSILVMVDEAHRSHGSALHANLMNALPNAARIGFTGHADHHG